jgi:DNA-binding MarR family transcriptional regulator
VSDLEREGYAERLADETDGRVQRVQATHAGRALLERVSRPPAGPDRRSRGG